MDFGCGLGKIIHIDVSRSIIYETYPFLLRIYKRSLNWTFWIKML